MFWFDLGKKHRRYSLASSNLWIIAREARLLHQIILSTCLELFNGDSNFLLTLLLIIDPQNHHDDKRSTTIAAGRYHANGVANGRGWRDDGGTTINRKERNNEQMNEQERSLYVGVLYVGWGWCVGVSLSSLRAVIFCWLWNIACDVSKPDFPYSI